MAEDNVGGSIVGGGLGGGLNMLVNTCIMGLNGQPQPV